jgi:dienelactone hydrolase
MNAIMRYRYSQVRGFGLRRLSGVRRLIIVGVLFTTGVNSESTGSTASHPAEVTPLPCMAALTLKGDIASRLVDGVDRFLLHQIERSTGQRNRHWKRDFTSAENYNKSVESNRRRLAHILGVRDPRVSAVEMELVGSTKTRPLVGRGEGYEIHAVRWPAFGDVHGEGLLLVPATRTPLANIVAIPDAAQTPEQIVGLGGGVPTQSQFARRLGECGCRVVVPLLIDRCIELRGGRTKMTNREFLYRSAFSLGRQLIGYDRQKVLAVVDWFTRESRYHEPKVGVIGSGEGGLVALYAAALDTRIDAACVSGYFDDRRNVWRESIDRNVFGLLDQFGDAELASLIFPRTLVIEAARGPEITFPPGSGAPSRIVSPLLDSVKREVERARQLVANLRPPVFAELVTSDDGTGPCATDHALQLFLGTVCPGVKLVRSENPHEVLRTTNDPHTRLARQMNEIDRHNQWLLRESRYVRAEFISRKLDTQSVEKYQRSTEPFREFFYDEVIGRFDDELMPPNPRSRRAYDTQKWTGYELVLDVFPDVMAYGILLQPTDLKEGERRPVVVCQHGLEGRPQHLITGDATAYRNFAARLAERGFITFAPQNLYIFGDRFRTLQRKANALGKTIFSIIAKQHLQIVRWLKSLPYVNPTRIGFYGLSYGGVTAMRVPAVVTDYSLSISSANFNDWVDKLASTRHAYSYLWTDQYEIGEFDLGETFNYAEMAALIAPRPFMVGRGHFDGVASDEQVAGEFAKVRFLYASRLRLADHCAIEWFPGGHSINGRGTFEFLHKHLAWPKTKQN